MIVSTLLGLAAQVIWPQFQPEFLALIGISALVALALSGLGLVEVAGFNAPSAWREARLMWVPFVIVLVLPFLLGVKTSDGGRLFTCWSAMR